tara:strand:+ start:8478 stop:8705 length:228 start_codon:yes stop_codon:yes gene_type:complete
MEKFLTTDDFAESLNTKPHSIRVRLCRTGSYFGIVPDKLPNGRLQWPLNGRNILIQKSTPQVSTENGLIQGGNYD